MQNLFFLENIKLESPTKHLNCRAFILQMQDLSSKERQMRGACYDTTTNRDRSHDRID